MFHLFVTLVEPHLYSDVEEDNWSENKDDKNSRYNNIQTFNIQNRHKQIWCGS